MRNDLGESLQYMIHHASTLKKFTNRRTVFLFLFISDTINFN
jgi:hypothetical protein